LNAEFREVPHDFRAEDISDTVLGSIGIAACRLGGGTLHLAFDADSGELSHFVDEGGGVVTPTLKGSAAAIEVASSAGIKLVLEHFMCDLRSMSCYWQDATREHGPTVLPLLKSAYSRLHFRTSKVQGRITRNAMLRLLPEQGIDCAWFARWPEAELACSQLESGESQSDPRRLEWAHILAMPFLRASSTFHFVQVDLPQIGYSQAVVHGLLGQRAVRPPANQKAHVEINGDAALLEGQELQFGHQGEGAISGEYREYKVHSVHTHRWHKYSLMSECDPTFQG